MVQIAVKGRERVRTTLDLPRSLRQRIERAVQRGAARSQNALVTQAVAEYLARLEREWIDDQFAQMADDAAYQSLNLQIAAEFEGSDWEALQTAEETT